MSKKKISLLITLIMFFCLTLLTGCGSVAFSLIQYPNGQIAQTFSVSLNKEIIEQGGYDYDVSVNKVISVLQNVITQQKLRFETLDESVCSEKVKQQVFKDLKVEQPKLKDGVVVAQMIFENATSYKYFYNLNNQQTEQSSYLTENHAFYKKVSTLSYTKFYNFLEDDIYRQATIEMQNYFSTNQMFSVNDVNFVYCYAVSQDYHLYSNADFVYYNNGLAMHMWRLNADQLDRVIMFYQIIPKPLLWYVLAVGLTFVLILILTIVSLTKSKTKNKTKTVNDFAYSKQSKALEEIYKKIEDGKLVDVSSDKLKDEYLSDNSNKNLNDE